MSSLNIHDISNIMAQGNYGVSYEPIIDIKTMEVFAYEALSRFEYKGKNVSPDVFFKVLHNNVELFFYVESILKKFQLANQVENKKLFVNLDPDTCLHEKQIEFWVELFQGHTNTTVEIIENSDEESVEDIENFMDWMDMYKIPYAYDDFGKPNSIFFATLLNKSKYIKLDMHFIQSMKARKSFVKILEGLVEFSRENSQYVILEGVETQRDLDVAKNAGVDYVQGYLFKEQFISAWNQRH